MTQNLNVCTICCRPEVVYDGISGRNAKTVEGYIVVNFEVTISDSFRHIKKNHFVTAKAAAADIDDSIKRKHIRVSLNICVRYCCGGDNEYHDSIAFLILQYRPILYRQ